VGKSHEVYAALRKQRPVIVDDAERLEGDDGEDVRALADGRIVPLHEQLRPVVTEPTLDCAPVQTWD
jgi:hypothetical protein